MAFLSKEQFLTRDDEERIFESKVWGGELKYRQATVADKSEARRMATFVTESGKTDLDNERLETALVLQCVLEPKLDKIDLDKLLQKSAGEITRLSNAILGNVK
jgi:hypothetical protein